MLYLYWTAIRFFFVIYFTTLPVSILHAVEFQEDELDRISKDVVVSYSKYYPDICLRGSGKSLNTSERTSGVHAEIRMEDLMSTHLENATATPAYSVSTRKCRTCCFRYICYSQGASSKSNEFMLLLEHSKLFNLFRPYGTTTHSYESHRLRIKRNKHELWNKNWRLLRDRL